MHLKEKITANVSNKGYYVLDVKKCLLIIYKRKHSMSFFCKWIS